MRAAALLLAACSSLAWAGEQETEDARLVESRALAAVLGSELRESLLSAVKAGGPLAAIDICRIQAPAIAQRIGRNDVRVGRTARRVRNPGNAADAGQLRILDDFERRLAAGEAADGIEQFDQTYQGGARYMKAIVTQPMCLTCHGPAIAPAVVTAIRDRYPDDEAVGFTPGALRGAFVVEWRAPESAP